MTKLSDRPLRTRVRLLAAGPVLLITLLLVAFFLFERFAALGDELDARGQTMARQLAPAAEYGVLSGNADVLVALLDPLMGERDVVYVAVRDAAGNVLVERRRPGYTTDAVDEGHFRRFRAVMTRQVVAGDEFDRLAGMGSGAGGAQAIGESEVVLATAGIVEMQRIVLVRALLIAALVLLVTLAVATRLADALARIEEARHSAENASRAKSEFLAMMSHELRTPMNGVLGMLELLDDTRLDATQKDYVDTARRSSEHLLVVINDVLDFSRIEGGRLALEQVEFDLGALLVGTVDGFTYQAAMRGIALDLEIDPQVDGLIVTSDPTRLRQVLVNLVGNAVKFTERGSVRVQVAGALADDGMLSLRIVVADTGIGIAPERIEQMFEPFRQGENSTSRHYGGTGLGLAISRRLTAMLGGTIEVESRVGTGARFTLRFRFPARGPRPDERRDETRALRESVRESGLAGRRVLLVEDNPVSQMVAQGMLRSLGMDVDVVADGEAALARAAGNRYDVVLMDLQMPGIDGVETARQLRESEDAGGRHTPVLAVTASVLAGERTRCREAGMEEFLTKPFTREALRAAIALALKRTRDPACEE